MTRSLLPLPTKALLRRGDLVRAGISKRQIPALERTGRLTRLHLRPGGRAYYDRAQVARLLQPTT